MQFKNFYNKYRTLLYDQQQSETTYDRFRPY